MQKAGQGRGQTKETQHSHCKVHYLYHLT